MAVNWFGIINYGRFGRFFACPFLILFKISRLNMRRLKPFNSFNLEDVVLGKIISLGILKIFNPALELLLFDEVSVCMSLHMKIQIIWKCL